MSRISKKLSEWNQNKLISTEQLQAITAYEEGLPKTKWGQIGMLLIGVGTFVLGIIAIVASNWYKIPASLKLTTAFTILIAVGIAIVVKRDEKSILVKDGLLAFMSLYCFAVIGLVAQVYNLHGELYNTGLFWSAITVLLITQAQHILLPLFWTCVFGLSLMAACHDWPLLKENLNSLFSFYIYVISLIVLIGRRFFSKAPLKRSLEYFTVGMWIIGLLFSSATWENGGTGDFDIAKILVQYILSAIVILGVWTDHILTRQQKIVFASGIVVFDLLLTIGFRHDAGTIAIVLSIFCLLCWALFFLSKDFTKLFNLTLILVAFKIFEIYAREAKDLLNTGLGLIVSGAIVMLLVFAWSKNHQNIQRRLQELIK